MDKDNFFTNIVSGWRKEDLETLNSIVAARSELKSVFFVAQMQQLIDLVLTCKRNAENEVIREEGGGGVAKAPGRKRRLEQETAERALKFLKASQEPGRHIKIPGEETRGMVTLAASFPLPATCFIEGFMHMVHF